MKWTSIGLSLACALSVWVCAGETFREHYELAPVKQVQFDAFGTLAVRQATYNRLSVEANEDLSDHIQLNQQGDRLLISDVRTDSIWFQTQRLWQQLTGSTLTAEAVHYELALQHPESITLNGFFDARLEQIHVPSLQVHYNGMGQLTAHQLRAKQLDMQLNGKLDARIADSDLGLWTLRFNGLGKLSAESVVSDHLQAELNGNVDCHLSGHSTQLHFVMQGPGRCQAGNLASNDAVIELGGHSDMVIKVKNTLAAKTEQGASLRYYGSPSVRSEGSNIRRINGGYQARTYY